MKKAMFALVLVWPLPTFADDQMVTATSFLPAAAHGSASVASGYDAARAGVDLRAVGEGRLARWLSVRAGVEIAGSERPFVGLRARLLDETDDGVTGTLGLAYQQDGIRDGEGRLELAVGVARAGLQARLAYAQDPEADDFKGDLQLAALHSFGGRFRAGGALHLQAELFSDDTKAQPGEPDLEASAGPVASVSVGDFALFAQVGVSAVRVERLDVGVLALAGVGAIF
jgi:hypothetical protein